MKITKRQLKSLIGSALFEFKVPAGYEFKKQLNFIDDELHRAGVQLKSFKVTENADIPNEFYNKTVSGSQLIDHLKANNHWFGTFYYGNIGNASNKDKEELKGMLDPENPDFSRIMLGPYLIDNFFYFKDPYDPTPVATQRSSRETEK